MALFFFPFFFLQIQIYTHSKLTLSGVKSKDVLEAVRETTGREGRGLGRSGVQNMQLIMASVCTSFSAAYFSSLKLAQPKLARIAIGSQVRAQWSR
jgi:hypothetical protein